MSVPLRRAATLAGALAVVVLAGGCPRGTPPQPFSSLWDAYAQRFLSADGRIVEHDYPDRRTTSEAQSYALFFALVANQPKRFARILDWTRANLAGGSLSSELPAWLWARRKDGSWGVVDANSASDADVWIAYTLLQAGRLWHKAAYARLGRAVAARAAAAEVAHLPGVGPVLVPAPKGFGPDKQGCYVLNPSYLPLPVLTALGAEAGPPWHAMARALPQVIAASTGHGFAPDWVRWCPRQGFGVAPAHGPAGSYGAVRVYLWAGMTPPAMTGSRQLLASLNGMGRYLHSHAAPPTTVDVATGEARGHAPPGFSAALLPYLARRGRSRTLARQRKRLRQARTAAGLYGTPPRYYDQNLALFALGYLTHAFRFGPRGQLEVNWK